MYVDVGLCTVIVHETISCWERY